MVYKKMEPMSRALRPGGEGTVSPKSVGGSAPFDLGSIKGPKNTVPGGPTTLGLGVDTPKAPPKMPRAPRAPSPPKLPKFR